MPIDDQLVPAGLDPEKDPTVLGELHRVRHEVRQDLTELPRVGVQGRHAVSDLDRDGVAAA
jgi:hypothetical protein